MAINIQLGRNQCIWIKLLTHRHPIHWPNINHATMWVYFINTKAVDWLGISQTIKFQLEKLHKSKVDLEHSSTMEVLIVTTRWVDGMPTTEIQLFQNLTMKIYGQGHVWSKVKVTFDLQNSKVKVYGQGQTHRSHLRPGVQSKRFTFHFVAIGPFLAEI